MAPDCRVEDRRVGERGMRWPRRWFAPTVAVLFVVLAMELFFSARLESPTFDEPAHLYAGYGYWLHSDFGVNPEHPPLVKLIAALPLLVERPKYPPPPNIPFRPASAVGGLLLLHPPGAYALVDHARVAVSLFLFCLALLVMLASREMFGQGTALFALTLVVFDPLLLAHGPLVGTDTGLTCCLFATVYTFYRYVKRPSWVRLGVCTLAAGLSLAAKHSAIFLFPILILLCVVEVALWRRQEGDNAGGVPVARSRSGYSLRLGVSLLVIAAGAIAILWAFYGFRYAARPDGQQIKPSSATYLGEMHQRGEAKTIAFAERHHLLPEAYLYGLTDVIYISNNGREMFLLGTIYPNGRWFYFPAAFLIKSTIGFLLLLALLPFARELWGGERRREVLFVAIPPIVFFAIAMSSKLDIGIRHILPTMPFLIVLAAAGAVVLARRSRAWRYAVAALLVLDVASSVHAFPNYLPYSNEFFGGPSETYRALSDSNVGWGGGLKAMHAYLEERHITQCWFAYSALLDPASFGVPCKRLPSFFGMLTDRGQQQVVPEEIQGPVFVSSEELVGSLWGGPKEMNAYQQFMEMRPARVVAGEIAEYDGTFDVKKVAAISHFMVAHTLLREGHPDQALVEAEKAVSLDPESLDAREMLISAYAANHRPEDAMREYQTAMRMYETVHPEFNGDREPPENPETR